MEGWSYVGRGKMGLHLTGERAPLHWSHKPHPLPCQALCRTQLQSSTAQLCLVLEPLSTAAIQLAPCASKKPSAPDSLRERDSLAIGASAK